MVAHKPCPEVNGNQEHENRSENMQDIEDFEDIDEIGFELIVTGQDMQATPTCNTIHAKRYHLQNFVFRTASNY